MRIAGVTLPEKRLEVALTAVYGIGRSAAKSLLDKHKIDWGTRPAQLTEAQETAVRADIESRSIEGNLKREVQTNIKRLKEIKAWRGDRHMKRLPARGQTTRSNSRTIRGNVRKTMTSGRRTLEKT